MKALVSGGVSESERKNLRLLLTKASKLRDPAYIKVQDAELEKEPICVISEYVRDSRTLSHVLHQRGGLPPHDVISYIRQLARALDEAQYHGLSRRRLLPSNVFLERIFLEGLQEKIFLEGSQEKAPFERSRVRLSPVVFLTEEELARRMHGAFSITKEAANYMSPEHYYGHPANQATDQYALGLIALSMLQGGPPISIERPADLAQLPRFFDNPREFFEEKWRDQAPGLSGVIARMLCKDPQARWPSMAAILKAIEPLQRSQGGQGVHVEDAKRSYCRYCRGRPLFYKTFYEAFFRRAPTTEGLFANVSMDRQYAMIDEAIEKLLNFRDGPEPTTLSRTREAHRRFQLMAADFDHFRDAFLGTLQAMGEQDPDVLKLLACGTETGSRLHETGMCPRAPTQTYGGAAAVAESCRLDLAEATSPTRRRRRR